MPNETITSLLPPNYQPSEDEEYMNPYQLEYFRQKLVKWRRDLLDGTQDTIDNLQSNDLYYPDSGDRASSEVDHTFELRTRDRAPKLIGKIDQALERINADEYGYCNETGHPIGIKRLDARPIATLSLEAQQRHEREEKLRKTR